MMSKASCKTTRRSIHCTHIRAECLSTYTLSLVHFSSKGCLSRLSALSSSFLHLFVPHKINTHKHTLKRERKTRAKDDDDDDSDDDDDDRFLWFFYPLFSSSSPLVRHRHPHQSPVAKTTFLNLPSSSGLITDGKTKKKTKKEKGFHRHHHVFFCDEYGTNLARNVQRFRKWIQSNRGITRRTDESANAFETVDE